MKKLFLGVIAASMFIMACHQPAAKGIASNLKGTDPGQTVSPASTGAVATDGPVMKFDTATHDFGKITQGDKVTYQFKFTNTGKTPLIITDAVASCGCTTPVWPKGPIKPGDGGQIAVTFNSLGKRGLQDKMITITANTNPRQNVVHMIGEVLEKK